MPEGDTIYGAAGRIRGALVDREIESIETPHPRFERDRWPERLRGRAVRAVDSKGKHLFIRFDGDLTLHSHLRMNGWWGVYRRGQRWGTAPSRAWLVIRTAEHEVVQFGGPVLELMTDSRSRFDQRIARLGPDILADEFDESAFLRRLREDDPSRGIGDALLDQRNLCGIGNLWKSEACVLAGLDLFSGEAYADVELDVDLKLPGYEPEVVEGLARHGLTERSLVSTMYPESLDRLGELDPSLRRGWSVPRVQRNYLKAPLYIRLPVLALAAWMRFRMPSKAAARIRAGGCEAIMSHQVLVSARLVRAVHEAGGQLYVWTVDEAPKIRALEALGVDGVITNDPRLFD